MKDGGTELPVTDYRMTRFWISLTQGVELVAVPHDGKINIFISRISVCRHKQFIRNQLGSAVKVHRIDRFIRGQRQEKCTNGLQEEVTC